MEPETPVTPEAHFADAPAAEGEAWEEVAEGRFMPMRTKGSCRGRALG